MAILLTISCTNPARFIGSFPASANNKFVLKRIKSDEFFSTYSIKSDAFCFRAKESGSSPSGSNKTLIFNPSSNNKSIPRMEAFIPAASPS
jgi:hypothetical protein